MRILGIDPGTTRIGFGVIDTDKRQPTLIEYGIIGGSGKDKWLDYRSISEQLAKIIIAHKPDKAGLERLFFTKNQKTAMSVGEVRGVMILTLALHGVPMVEFTPQQVKQAVSAYGAAGKAQVERMVRLILNIKDPIKPDDAADALAIAICCANTIIY